MKDQEERMDSLQDRPKPPLRSLKWTGRGLSWLVVLLFALSASMKFRVQPEVSQSVEGLGIPPSLLTPLGTLEMVCVVLYLIPVTSVLGAILLTGYVGGAIFAHWRLGESILVQAALGVVLWLGLYLREPRLWRLIPFRLQD
jgi:uncharacterized membrane protein YphA (DoxX/SURF4 family)